MLAAASPFASSKDYLMEEYDSDSQYLMTQRSSAGRRRLYTCSERIGPVRVLGPLRRETDPSELPRLNNHR